jgi:hypothetical protein
VQEDDVEARPSFSAELSTARIVCSKSRFLKILVVTRTGPCEASNARTAPKTIASFL